MITELSDELDIQPGHRVLEIAGGPVETGPYDRILVTDPVTMVRWAWAEQLAPGGLLSVDVVVAGTSGGHVILRREPDRLTGHFCPLWGTCPVHRKVAHPRPHSIGRHDRATADESTSTRDPHLYDIGALWLMFLASPPRLEVSIGKSLDTGDGIGCYSFSDSAGSWVEVEMTEAESSQQPNTPWYTGPRRVWQGGPRRLWTEFERAHQIWTELGRPAYKDVGMTVTPDRQWIWLDGPGRAWQADL
jgi:hypothetical protein